MSTKSVYDLIIIGGGPAGYSAARYASIYMLKHILFEGVTPGGQLLKTTYVENYPGTGKILGSDLVLGPIKKVRDTARAADGAVKVDVDGESVNVVTGYRADAEDGGAVIIAEDVKEITPPVATGGEFRIDVGDGSTVFAKTVIVATGAIPLTLKFPAQLNGQREYWNLMTCAVCDGRQHYFRDQPVAVIGGGDAAMEDAIFLAHTSKPVYLIHRSDKFRASPIMLARAHANTNIEFITNTVVQDVTGEERKAIGWTVTALDLVSGDSKRTLPVAGVFFAIGHRPNSQLLLGKAELFEDGYAKVVPGTDTATSVPGLHVAGDVADRKYRQAICAVSSGAQAVYNVNRYLQNLPTV